MHRGRIAHLLFMLIALSAGALPPAEAAPPSEFLTPVIALKELIGSETINLRGDTAEASVSIPLSGRVKLQKADLEIHFSNSPALLTHRSQLSLELNGHQIGVARLSGREPIGTLKARIPVRFFKPGYNTLSFRASQHYLDTGCESPGAPELWTQVDASLSRIRFSYRNSRIEPALDRLGELMDAHVWDHYDIQLLTAGDSTPDRLHVEAGSMIAQAVALQTRFLPVRIHHELAIRSDQAPKTRRPYRHPHLVIRQRGMDAILFGTYDELEPLLGDGAIDRQRDHAVAIERMDGDRTRFLMIVAGRDGKALMRAARDLARLASLPQSRHANSREATRIIHSFSSLDFSTWSMQGMNGSKQLRIWLFPEQLAPPHADIELDIHMSYGAGVREDSSLNVLVNDHFVQAVFLHHPEGQHYRHYKIKIPPHALLPGENLIRFEAALTPAISGNCTMIRTEQLRLTIYEDSDVYLPIGREDRVIRMPDLQALVRAGYPFGQAGGDDRLPQASMLIASMDSDWLAAAWSLTARIAQSRRFPVQFSVMDDLKSSGAGNVLLLASRDRLPDLLGAELPPIMENQNQQLRLMMDRHRHLLSQFRHQQKWITLFAPVASSSPEQVAWTMTGFDLWGAMRGDSCIWPANVADPKVRCFRTQVSAPYERNVQGGDR